MLHRLALEQRAGRLRISPGSVVTGSEALLPETRHLMEHTWDIVVENGYGASEVGGISSACGQGPWMHLNDDLVIIEVVDDAGRTVPPGTTGARIFITGLMNKVMPIIRYELDDRVTLLDQQCPCGSAHRVVGDIHGRTGEVFRFGADAEVHQHAFSSVLGANYAIAEYQVRQTETGVDVDVVAEQPVDTAGVQAQLKQSLAAAGAADVTVTVVADIARQATGKVRRFVPTKSSG